jgi:hypothetical protein
MTSRGTESGPSEKELLDAVASRPEGIHAVELTEIFTKKGLHRHSVQRVIQRALDRGDLELGSKLRLHAKAHA